MYDKLEKLTYYAELAQDLVENPDNEEKRDMWSAIDRMYNCDITIPDSIQELVGENAKFVSTLPKSSIDAVTRFLSTRNPSIHLLPLLPSSEEHQRMEFGETVLRWHWNRMNERGSEPFRTKLTHQVAKYAACAYRTKYMPWELERGDLYGKSQKKHMRRHGDFNFVPYNIQNVYPAWTEDYLFSVLGVRVISVQSLIYEYGKDNPAVIKLLNKTNTDKNSPADQRSAYVSMFDYMNDRCSAMWFVYNGMDTNLNTNIGDEDLYELKRVEHGLGFLPWVVEDYGKPLLAGAYEAQLFEQSAIQRTIFHADMLKKVVEEDTIISAPNANDPNLLSDGNTLSGEKVVPIGVSVTRLTPHQMDPNLMAAINMTEKELAASAAVSALVAIEQYIGGNTPFSSINAAQSTAAAHLGPVQNAVERAIEKGLYQELQWVAMSGKGLMGYREKQRGSQDTDTARMGARFMMRGFKPGLPPPNVDVIEFDPDDLMIKVELNPMNIQDKQAESNLAVIKQQAGLSFATSTEHLIDDPEAEMSKRGEEMLLMAQLEADKALNAANIQAQAIIEVAKQTAQMIMQQAQQPQGPEGQSGIPPTQQTQTNRMNAGAQTQVMRGRDVRGGAPPMAQVAPGETPVSVTGKTPGGQELA